MDLHVQCHPEICLFWDILIGKRSYVEPKLYMHYKVALGFAQLKGCNIPKSLILSTAIETFVRLSVI